MLICLSVRLEIVKRELVQTPLTNPRPHCQINFQRTTPLSPPLPTSTKRLHDSSSLASSHIKRAVTNHSAAMPAQSAQSLQANFASSQGNFASLLQHGTIPITHPGVARQHLTSTISHSSRTFRQGQDHCHHWRWIRHWCGDCSIICLSRSFPNRRPWSTNPADTRGQG